jgi:Zinc finger, C2H2 type
MHLCNLCNRTFKRKENLNNHQLKKVCQNKNHQCSKCNGSFTSKGSLNRHIRQICGKDCNGEDNEGELLKLIKDMQTQINDLKEENKIIKSEKVNNSINNSTIYNGDVNITVNVVPFGKEDLSKLNKNDLLKVFRGGFNSALRLTETTHFNPNYPEFHNVYISSMKNKYAMTYDGSDWALVMKDDLIDQMYDHKRDYIEENLDEFFESLTNSQVSALQRWMDTDDDHHYVKKIKNDMKLMLYNKRKMAINAKYQRIEYLDTDLEVEDVDIKVIKMPKHNVEELDVIVKKKRVTAPRNGRYRKVIIKRAR